MADRVSAACDPTIASDAESDAPYLDPYFGLAWSWTPRPGAALYGRTADIPPTPIEQHGNGQYLRVPFRRIAIVEVGSLAELRTIAASVRSEDPSIQGVWRGQANQYWLPRENDDRLRLYGDADVLEPSMLPSASRSKQYFPDLFAAWSGLLDLYSAKRLGRLASTYTSKAEHLESELGNFGASYNHRLWGLATAQHYGLPSVGLDLTPDIEVALFFALHSFQIDRTTGAMTVTRADASAEPMIYGLGGFKNDLLDDEKLSPPWLQCARPRAQKAMFYTTAWGASSNKAADRIYVALKIMDHTSWRSPLTKEQLFPNGPDDPFVEFLIGMRGKISDPAVNDLLARIYFLP
jgi:hypothetical protein